MATLRQIKHELCNEKGRSAWRKGVINYAWELIDNVEQSVNYLGLREDDEIEIIDKDMLKGALNWHEYSWRGCSLIYNEDIANELCAPWELKKTNNGRRKLNRSEEWLDVQARALKQAAHLIISIQYKLNKRSDI